MSLRSGLRTQLLDRRPTGSNRDVVRKRRLRKGSSGLPIGITGCATGILEMGTCPTCLTSAGFYAVANTALVIERPASVRQIVVTNSWARKGFSR